MQCKLQTCRKIMRQLPITPPHAHAPDNQWRSRQASVREGRRDKQDKWREIWEITFRGYQDQVHDEKRAMTDMQIAKHHDRAKPLLEHWWWWNDEWANTVKTTMNPMSCAACRHQHPPDTTTNPRFAMNNHPRYNDKPKIRYEWTNFAMNKHSATNPTSCLCSMPPSTPPPDTTTKTRVWVDDKILAINDKVLSKHYEKLHGSNSKTDE